MGPLSSSSLLEGASLALSHPGSDDFTVSSSAPLSSHGASGPLAVSSLPGGAGSSSSVPLLDNSGTSEVPGSSGASGPGSASSLVDGAESVVSLESLDDLSGRSLTGASGPLSVTFLGGGAVHGSSVLESSDDTSSHVSADLSLLVSELVDNAVLGALSE